jgi:polysaccharide export outer membrane protein
MKTEERGILMPSQIRFVLAAVLFVSLDSCFNLVAQSPASGRKPDAPAASTTAANTPGGVDYLIGPQDVVNIDVWKEPEITRTIPVRPDGKISLPLLNDVQAAGLTAMQLAANIREGLTKFLNGPQVTVTVTQINSRRVFVTGEVAHSGAMPLLPGMTALQALSASGGFTQFAREKSIYILRTENGKQVKHPYNYKDVLKGKAEDIPLLPGDVIVVP